MSKSKQSAKEVVLPHSQAKLDLYKNYLSHYLRILTLTPYCDKINLFDIYCGVGLYSDGNPGSPVITKQTIKENNELILGLGKSIKPIELFINDLDPAKIANVKVLMSNHNLPNCTINYFNKDADEMLEIVATKVNSSSKNEKNLVFIDPYGYSQIQKDKIYELLKNNKTEILLFLPVMQMYRFKDIALSNQDRRCYEDLRNFIFSFFPEDHNLHEEKVENIFDFIYEIKKALGFGSQYLSCAHYIQRDKGNYYALFFITANMYGLEKMVEAKWKLDPVRGSGFSQKQDVKQLSMFSNEFETRDHRLHLGFLKDQIMASLRNNKLSNVELYSIALRNEFQPIHCKRVLIELLNESKIEVINTTGELVSQAEIAYLNYTHYKTGERKYFIQKRR